MLQKVSEPKEVWRTIFIFLSIVTITSALFHYAIVNLYPSSIYIGGLMWCPALAAIVTLKLKRRSVSSLKWNWGNWKYISLSYFVPALFVLITYLFIWSFSLGGLPNGQMILDWAEELGLAGIGTLSPTFSVIVAVILLGIVGLIRAMATKRLRLHNLITFLKNK